MDQVETTNGWKLGKEIRRKVFNSLNFPNFMAANNSSTEKLAADVNSQQISSSNSLIKPVALRPKKQAQLVSPVLNRSTVAPIRQSYLNLDVNNSSLTSSSSKFVSKFVDRHSVIMMTNRPAVAFEENDSRNGTSSSSKAVIIKFISRFS